MTTARGVVLGATLALAGLASGCIGPTSRGSFERTLTVTGPTRLYLTNGSGSARISAGASGQVHVRGEFRVRTLPWENSARRAADLAQDPPIRQEGSLIHIGLERYRGGNVSVDYDIEVPPETEVRAIDGSGDLSIGEIAGPVNLTTGSGDLTVKQIQGDVHAVTGSGDIHVESIKGAVELTAGSGDVVLGGIGGVVRVNTGSGDITLTSPGDTVTLRNGSGDIRVTGASSDLRIRTGSGTVNVDGSPSTGAYWEIHAGTGDVSLRVPPTAAFRFYARTRMGDIRSSLPLTILERSKREIRAVVGEGSARVEVQTGTGDVRLNSSRP
jgi:DUF4097 and DUF4098 domain-containing protein YvlB